MIFKILLLINIILISSIRTNAAVPQEQTFYFDAYCFRSDSLINNNYTNLSRIDVYLIIPYETLYFIKSQNNNYIANYEINILITDSLSNKIIEKNYSQRAIANDYITSQGGSGAYDYNQKIFTLEPGHYSIIAQITDTYTKRILKKSRDITCINYTQYLFSASTLMILSSIEENKGNYTITPHLSDNVSNFDEGFFIFFETYNSKNQDSCDFIYKLTSTSNNILFTSKPVRQLCQSGTSRHYLKINLPKEARIEKSILKLFIYELEKNNSNNSNYINNNDYSDNRIIAVSERSLTYQRAFSGIVLQDLPKTIKQLKYVAASDEIGLIEDAKTDDDKLRLFADFWAKLDPTPNTERNEAYEQYYSRVAYANEHFRSYTEGWRTDKGMVFIIFGRPMNIEKSTPSTDGRTYERWTYRSNRQFTFVDYSGFGDFRLYSPPMITDKYKYEPE